MTMKVRGEPAKPLIPKMFVYPRGDWSVDQRYRNAAHRGGSNNSKQRSKKVSPGSPLPPEVDAFWRRPRAILTTWRSSTLLSARPHGASNR